MTALICTPDAQRILDAVKEVDPEHAPDLQPNFGGEGWTHCNGFIFRLCVALGVFIPAGLLARQQIAWLDSPEALAHGWMSCGEEAAQAAAFAGKMTIVGWVNPDPNRHSHIAAVIPKGPGTWIAQAGLRNYNAAPLTHGFGGLNPLKFFTRKR